MRLENFAQMRLILLFLLLFNLIACSAFKSRKSNALDDLRMPIENSNYIKKQENEIEEAKVNNVINEYRYNDNFDDASIADITLEEVAPNYMEPMDIDYQVGLHNESVQEVKLHETKHKPYTDLSKVPERKVSSDKQKEMIKHKKQELENLKKKSNISKSKLKPKTQSKNPVPVSSTRPSQEEIEAKLKQLQANKPANGVNGKNNTPPPAKIDPNKNTNTLVPPTTNKETAISQNTSPITSSAPTNKSVVSSPSVTLPSIPNTGNSDLSTVTSSPPAVPANNTKPSAPSTAISNSSPVVNPSTSVQTNVPPAVPANNTQPSAPSTAISNPSPVVNPSASVPAVTSSNPPNTPTSSTPDNTMRKKIKINQDQSVEVYDNKVAPPPPPMLPPQ
jgi:hypothetical protein